MALSRLQGLAALAVVFGLAGCTAEADGGGETGADSETACEEIIAACHEKDDGTVGSPVNDCHSVGHDDDAAACTAQHDSCIQICNDAPELPPHGSSESGHHETDHSDPSESGTETSGPTESTSTTSEPTTDDPSTTDESTTGSSSSGGDDAANADCDELGSGCHDAKSKFGRMCHDVGHDGDETACAEIWVACREECGF